MAPRTGLAMAVWLCAARAGADAGRSSLVLEWNAGPGCPDRDAMMGSIAELVGRLDEPTPVVAKVNVVSAEGTWNATVWVRRGELANMRLVRGPSCADVADAAAVIIALVLDPGAVVPEFGGPSEPPPADRPANARRDAPPIVTRDRGDSVLAYGLAAHALLDVGALPDVSYGASATAFASGAHLRLELGAYVLANRTDVVPNRPQSSGHFGLWSTTATSCATTSPEVWTAGWCAGFELGRMTGEASGPGVAPREARVLWGALGTGPTLLRRISPHVELVARADLLFPFTRSTFYVDEVGDVFRPSPVAWRFRVGTEVHF